jgi:DNA processing protein
MMNCEPGAQPGLVQEVTDTVATLRPSSARHESDERFAERTARVILSSLAEPGDGVLGDLLVEFGAIDVLDRLWGARAGGAGLGRHEFGRALARAGDDKSGDNRSAVFGPVGLSATEPAHSARRGRTRATSCDSSSEGRARDWGANVSESNPVEASPRHDLLEPFRSDEWAGSVRQTRSDRRVRSGNRDGGSGGASLDSALKGVSTSLETWMLRLDRVEQSLNLSVARSVSAELLIPGDDDWPLGVDDLGRHAPVVLWVRGRASDLGGARPAVALVGARACSAYGQQVATDAAWHLARRGATLFSGGAYGIDGAVHRAAIRAGGRTVAFLAGGVDRLYPAGHHALLESIIDNGALVSEVPCGTTPTKWRFLQRNRLIAAASQATVVVEAGSRSGSLNTAGHAAHLGRPLGAVPGPVTTAHSIGCHRLLREYGATCVTSGDEMMQLIEPLHGSLTAPPAPRSTTTQAPTRAPAPTASPDQVPAPTPALAPDRVPAPTPTPTPDQVPAPTPVVAPRPGHSKDEEPRARRVIDALSARTPRRALDLSRLSGLPLTDVVAELGSLQLRGAVTSTETGWLYVPRTLR